MADYDLSEEEIRAALASMESLPDAPLPDPIVKFSVGKGLPQGRTTNVQTATASWSDLVKLLSFPVKYKNSRFISPGLQPKPDEKTPGTNRRDATGHSAHIIALDFDGKDGRGDPLRKISDVLNDLWRNQYAYIVCSSFSNLTKADRYHARWRLILRAEYPIPNNEVYRRAWKSAADWILDRHGLGTDPALGHIAAVSYIGRPEDKSRSWIRASTGKGWEYELESPRDPFKDTRRRSYTSRGHNPEAPYQYVAKVPGSPAGTRHQDALRLGSKLQHNFSLSHEALMDVLFHWGQTCEPPMSEHELSKISQWFANKE